MKLKRRDEPADAQDRWDAILAGKVARPSGYATLTKAVPRWLRRATADAVGGSDGAYDGWPIGECGVPGLDWDKLVRKHRRSIRPAGGGTGTDRWPSWEQWCAAWRLIRAAHPTTATFYVELLVSHDGMLEVGALSLDVPGVPPDELYLAVNAALQTGCELFWPETRFPDRRQVEMFNLGIETTTETRWVVTGCHGIASHWHDGLLAEWLREADEARERKKNQPPAPAPPIDDNPPF